MNINGYSNCSDFMDYVKKVAKAAGFKVVKDMKMSEFTKLAGSHIKKSS